MSSTTSYVQARSSRKINCYEKSHLAMPFKNWHSISAALFLASVKSHRRCNYMIETAEIFSTLARPVVALGLYHP